MVVTVTSMISGFLIIFALSLFFMFFIKGSVKDLIILMGIFSIFAFIGGLVDFWVIVIFLILTVVVVMIDSRGGSGGERSE